MKTIPIAEPLFSEAENFLLKKTLKCGWVSQGPLVAKFEEAFAGYIGVKYAVALSSCTTALHLALIAAGIKENDEVIVPAFTFIATANAVLYQKAKPVFVDINPDTFNIDVGSIEKKITAKTKAIIPVHLFGLPADLNAIMKLSRKYSLKVIEDAACAQGAKYKGKMIGASGNLACFSFHPRKIITTGEGGMITTNDRNLKERLDVLRSHGASVSDRERHVSDKIIFPTFSELGYNYRMTDIQAAIGLAQMKKIAYFLKKRKKICDRYNKSLKELTEIRLPENTQGYEHSWQSYVIKINDNCRIPRDKIMLFLRSKGIQTRRGTNAVPLERFYRKKYGYKPTLFPEAFMAEEQTLALPVYPALTEKDQVYIIKSLKTIVK